MAADKAQATKTDLNKANRDDLVALPGVGQAAADAILKYRDERGGFGKLDELEEVPGIGAQTVDGLRSYVILRGKNNGSGQAARKAEKTGETPERAAQESAGRTAAAGEHAARTGQEVAGRAADVAERTAEKTVDFAEAAGKSGFQAMAAASEKGAETLAAGRDAASRGMRQLEAQGKDSAEAVAASGETMLAGAQEIQRAWLGLLQEQMHDAMETGRALGGCRSPQQLVEVQSRFARSSWTRFANGGARLTDLTVRVMSAGARPLQVQAQEKLAEAARRTRT